jgi:tetratricopeptide (TPR) repeat protein
MSISSETLKQDLDLLTSEQLQQVADFIAFLKFRDKGHSQIVLNSTQHYDLVWYNRGVALGNLGRYDEAVTSYDRAVEINPNYDLAWYNRACFYALQNKIEPSLENLTQAITLNPECLEMAKTDTDFDNIRSDSRFKAIINSD